MSETNILARVDLGAAGLYGLNLKVEKLNKRAKKYGMDLLVVRIVRDFTVENKKSGFDEIRYDVEIVGCAPCINGWHLTAVIENDDTIGTLVKVVPGKFEDEDYSEYRAYDFRTDQCDHCRTSRKRNKVYVLKNDEGFAKCIGSNCLADYVRNDSASDFAAYAEFCDAAAGFTDEGLAGCADEEGFGGCTCFPNTSLKTFLRATQTCIRTFGWTGRSAAYDNPELTASADDAIYLLYGHGKGWEKWVEQNELFATDGDNDLADKATEWVQSLQPEQTERSEYLDTVRKIGQAGETSPKLAGFTASIIGAYQREQGYAVERAERAANAKVKVHTGCIKERLKDRVVTVKRVRYFDGEYGTTTIVAMEMDLADGTVAPLTWFASKSLEFAEGSDYNFTGTVKAHKSDDKYGPQTLVNRCKLTKV